MKQLTCALLLGVGLLSWYAPRAEAHGPGYTVIVHQGKVVRKFRPDLPRWVHRHQDFRRWYAQAPHYQRHPDWHHLYRLYQRDAKWHRHSKGQGHRGKPHKHGGHRHGPRCRH